MSATPDWGAMLAEEKEDREKLERARMVELSTIKKLMGEISWAAKKKIAAQITEKLRALWIAQPREITDTERVKTILLFEEYGTLQVYFAKWVDHERDIGEPEHSKHPKPYFLKALCGMFRLETEADFTKAMDAHIKYITRALYYNNIHPDKHAITAMSMKTARYVYAEMNSYMFPTCLYIDLVDDLDRPCADIDVSKFPEEVIGSVLV